MTCHLSVFSCPCYTDIVREQGLVGDEQYQWLKKDLAENEAAQHTFVFMRRPVWSLINPEFFRFKHRSFIKRANRDRLAALLKEEKVDIIFAGHEHFFNQLKRDGITQVIAGCSGAAPYTDEAHGGFPHYVVVEANRAEIELTVVKSTGERLRPEAIPAPAF